MVLTMTDLIAADNLASSDLRAEMFDPLAAVARYKEMWAAIKSGEATRPNGIPWIEESDPC